MMADKDQGITADDLKLVADETSDGGDGVDDGKEVAAVDQQDNDNSGGKDDTSDTSLLDGIDDDDETGEEKTEKSKDSTGQEEKKQEKEEAKEKQKDDTEEKKEAPDWRASFIAKALAGLDNKLTAAALEKRREALTKRLSRYKTAEDYMMAGLSAQEKINSGDFKKKLSDDATDEERAAWRKENDIPAEAKDYDIPKIAGHIWQDRDVPFIDSFKVSAHAADLSQRQMNAVTKWYADTMTQQQDEMMHQLDAMDKEDRQDTRDVLRAELGATDFKSSLLLMDRLLKDDEAMPNGVGAHILSARYQDENGKWRRLINNPDMARLLINNARDTYGDAVINNGDARDLVNNRKKEIEEVMSKDINEYYRRGLDKELLEINQREEASASRRRR